MTFLHFYLQFSLLGRLAMRHFLGQALALSSSGRKLQENSTSCQYGEAFAYSTQRRSIEMRLAHAGYANGRDSFGADCADCLEPSEWATCPEWNECGGMYQSPIDIDTTIAFTPAAGTAPINYSYVPESDRFIYNTGKMGRRRLSP